MTTLVHESTDTVGHLDFTPACACNSAVCSHGSGEECEREAVAILTLHLINECDRATATPGGDHVGPICQTCLDDLTAAARAWIDRYAADARQRGVVACCKTCDAPLMHLSDIVRDVRSIR